MTPPDTHDPVHDPLNNQSQDQLPAQSPTDPEIRPQVNPLARAYARRFPGEVAAHLIKHSATVIAQTLDGLPDDVAAGVIARMPHGHAVRILAARDDASIAAWIDAAGLDHALAILLHVSSDRRERILECLSSRRTRRALRKLVIYPPDTAGAALNPAAPRLEASLSLADAVEFLRGDDLEPERLIWLVDGDGRYRGLLDSGRALAARTHRAALEEFLVRVKALRAETTLTNARDANQWLEHSELPVIDEHDHLLGSITRVRLMAALGRSDAGDSGLVDGLGALAHQYFRVLAICLGDLFDARRPRR
ncbi:MAG: hypothetical protein LC637_08600 [Xanthomonadaceae bacterium]|nr:hypothetical protein [Xanthomonadaceae bacterium]